MMLYKLIIVDDERIIREGLRDMVNWSLYGFELVQLFPDGRDAIEYIEKMPVDVVLTDIKMTFISGIEVAKYVHENKPHLKVVLISGYKEFTLAHEAIKYSVKDYILKPTDMDNLVRVMTDIKNEIDAEREELKRVAVDKGRLEESFPILREQFFIDLLMGVLSDEDNIKKRFQILYPHLKPEQCVCFTANFTIDQYDDFICNVWKYGKNELLNSLNNFFALWNENINYQIIYKVHESIRVFGIFTENDNICTTDDIEQNLVMMADALDKQFAMHVNSKIVNVYNNIFEVVENASPVIPVNADNNLQDMMSREDLNRIKEKQKLFLSNLTAGNTNAVKNLFHSLLKELSNFDLRSIKNFLVDMFSNIADRLHDSGVDTGGSFDYTRLLTMKDIDEIEEWGCMTINMIAECVTHPEEQETGIISRAKSYIRDNCNRDLSLEEVASYFYLSPFYFSRIFKQQTGENFIDYVVKIKIEKAVKLLEETNYKTYEISDIVGYKSVRYFSRIFKLNTGYTPSEYKARIWNKKGGDGGEN